MSGPALQERHVSDRGMDDSVLPWSVELLDVRGRLARLGPAIDQILAQHAYPVPVARLVGEAAALTVLLGVALKQEGRFQLQTRSDGAVDLLVVDFDAPDRLRAFARFDAAAVAQSSKAGSAELLGRGHLAFTIEQGAETARYQGVVPLDGQGLEAAAHQYFLSSEQIPTIVRLAAGQNVTPEGTQWRAGGLLVQFLPSSSERVRQRDLHPGDVPEGAEGEAPGEEDAWLEAKALAATVEDHELLDPLLSGERLLFRLFHECGVKVFTPQPVHAQCRCSQERVESMLRQFSAQERADMVGENGRIGVTCEFCSVHREFEAGAFE